MLNITHNKHNSPELNTRLTGSHGNEQQSRYSNSSNSIHDYMGMDNLLDMQLPMNTKTNKAWLDLIMYGQSFEKVTDKGKEHRISYD